MTPNLTWGKRLAPIIVLQSFLWLTLALFAYGPWQWPMRDPATLYGFICSAHVALLLGYLSVAHRAPVEAPPGTDARRLIWMSLWATAIMMPFASYARTGNWVPDVVGGILNPGKAYLDAHSGEANAAAYLRILLAPMLAILIPLAMYLGRTLPLRIRVFMAIGVFVVILLALSTGQRRDLADLLVIMPFMVAGAHWSGVCRLRRTTIVAGVVGCLLALAGFVAYFAYSHISRVGAETASYGVNPVTRQMPDMNSPILAAIPDDMKPGGVALLNYLTTGYYGLSLTLDREVQPMYGMGHSMFLTRNVEKLANQPAFGSRSLPVQISDKDGFTYPVFWCTAYPYFANDIGFFGTVVMLLLLGRALALSWIDMLGGKNPFAVVTCSMLLILAFYLPATNRMLQDGDGLVAFYSWLLIWGCSRMRLQLRAPALRAA